MARRGLVVFGFLLAAVVLVSSHATVATEGELAGKDAEKQQWTKDGVQESMVNPKTCPYGCGYWINGRCRICRPPPAVDDEKRLCPRGCCGKFRGRCTHCCHTAAEATAAGAAAGDAAAAVGEDQKHNCGSRGCCGRFRGHCTHCCHAAAGGGDRKAEAVAEPKN